MMLYFMRYSSNFGLDIKVREALDWTNVFLLEYIIYTLIDRLLITLPELTALPDYHSAVSVDLSRAMGTEATRVTGAPG